MAGWIVDGRARNDQRGVAPMHAQLALVHRGHALEPGLRRAVTLCIVQHGARRLLARGDCTAIIGHGMDSADGSLARSPIPEVVNKRDLAGIILVQVLVQRYSLGRR